MVRHVLVAVYDPFLRPTVDHGLLVVTDQATDVQLPYRGLVTREHSFGDLSGHGVGSVFYLREMTLEARKISA